ncbi:hypothetical protein L9F63_015836, partial [Diploptera punctata]
NITSDALNLVTKKEMYSYSRLVQWRVCVLLMCIFVFCTFPICSLKSSVIIR